MSTTYGADQNYIVVFALDEPRYALPLANVERIVQAVEITPLPAAPEIVIGVINLQGQILPVLDVRKRFRLPARELQIEDELIIARTAKRVVVLAVDSVNDVRDASKCEPVNADQALPLAGYVQGIVKTEDGIVLIHDLDKFLSLDEERALDRALASGHGTV